MTNKINSKIQVGNKGRKFGAATKYVYCEIDNEPALFTTKQLILAKLRARKNPEDLPKKSFWGRWL